MAVPIVQNVGETHWNIPEYTHIFQHEKYITDSESCMEKCTFIINPEMLVIHTTTAYNIKILPHVEIKDVICIQ
jgi:hypothetical protein